jgi:hypothetical protein
MNRARRRRQVVRKLRREQGLEPVEQMPEHKRNHRQAKGAFRFNSLRIGSCFQRV